MNKRSRKILAAIFILIPFAAYFNVPFYNAVNPVLDGLPFYYWFQILMLPISAVLFFCAANLIDG